MKTKFKFKPGDWIICQDDTKVIFRVLELIDNIHKPQYKLIMYSNGNEYSTDFNQSSIEIRWKCKHVSKLLRKLYGI